MQCVKCTWDDGSTINNSKWPILGLENFVVKGLNMLKARDSQNAGLGAVHENLISFVSTCRPSGMAHFGAGNFVVKGLNMVMAGDSQNVVFTII